MAVYVDEVRDTPRKFRPAKWRYNRACHMMADTDKELEAMAQRIQLRKDWRHGDHYDLTVNKRSRAIAAGAIQVTARELVALRQRVL